MTIPIEAKGERVSIPARDLWHNVMHGFRAPGAYQETSEGEIRVNFDTIVCDPRRAAQVLQLFAEKINSEINQDRRIDFLGFLEKDGDNIGALTMCLGLSAKTDIPNFVMRPKPGSLSEKTIKRSQAMQILLISDHSGDGQELLEAINYLQSGDNRHTVQVLLFSLDSRNFPWEKFEDNILPRKNIW